MGQPPSTLGDNGNVYQVVNNRSSIRSESINYDALNRVANAQQTTGTQWGESYTIDAWGSMTAIGSYNGKPHESLSTSALPNNQLLGFGYDAAGNMTSNGSYVYDAENRLIATAGYSYIYDGDGQRVEKCTEGTTAGTCASGAVGTLYWRGTSSDPLSETDLTGVVQNTYVFFNGHRVARRDSAGLIHYYFSDHLGSHGVVVNATGSTCEQDIDYYPYGGVEHDYCATVPQNYKFTGKERDSESGLDYFGARYNDSGMGRWMSPDAINITDDRVVNPANTLNKYIYGGNNPLKYVDPDGRDITVFYYPATLGNEGHFSLFASDPSTGNGAELNFGPVKTGNFWSDTGSKINEAMGGDEPGDVNYGRHIQSADDLRQDAAALTIQTNPEDTQKAIDAIKKFNSMSPPYDWNVAGANCTTVCRDILNKVFGDADYATIKPSTLWRNLFQKFGAPYVQRNEWWHHQSYAPRGKGTDWGSPRYDMNTFDWLYLSMNRGCQTSWDKNGVTVNCP